MATGIDFGKQVGPLPLGAWFVVVGVGVGIAYYTRKQGSSAVVVESGNGTPGVGAGGSGMYTELTPVVPSAGAQKPTTNEQWGVNAINWLLANGYPATVADSAVRKYLAGTKMSVQEYTMIGIVLVALGAPPQVLPPGENQDPVPPPTTPPTNPPPTNPPPTTAKYMMIYQGNSIDQWVAGVGVSEVKLALLNPGLWGPALITWKKDGVGFVPAGTPGAIRAAGSTQSIRVA